MKNDFWGLVIFFGRVLNVNNSSGNFGFLTQMGDRIIQPAISMVEIYKTHLFTIPIATICLEHFFEIQNISKDNELNPPKSSQWRA